MKPNAYKFEYKLHGKITNHKFKMQKNRVNDSVITLVTDGSHICGGQSIKYKLVESILHT